MPRSTPVQTAFNAGELSPRLLSRLDLDRYRSGAERMENFIALVQGPALRRSGFRWVDRTVDTKPARLIAFEVSDESAFMMSLTEGRIRFFRDEALLLDGGANPVELTTPYAESELFEVQHAQNADILYLVHRNHAMRKITRTGAATFTIETVELFDGPYNSTGFDSQGEPSKVDLTMTAGIAGDTKTVTASAALFATSDVGRLLRIKDDTVTTVDAPQWTFGTITAFTSDTSVDIELGRGSTGATGSRFWRLGAFYTGNHPRAITFDDQRLVVGGDADNPQTAYASVSNDFENFTPTGSTNRAEGAASGVSAEVLADNSLRLTLSANNVNSLQWLFSLRTLLAATRGGLWSIQASTQNEPLAPDNVGARRSSDRGGIDVQPEAIGTGVVFASNTGRRLFRGQFSLELEAYGVDDLTSIADHLMLSGIKQMAWAGDPNNLLWLVTNDGELRSVTVDEANEALAFHRHTIGGSDAKVESVGVIPATEGAVTTGARGNVAHDQLWVVTSRTVNGATLRSVEFMEEPFFDDHSREDAFFVDAGVSYSQMPKQTVFGGLSHLEGETVSILADGSVVSGKVVSGGQVTLDEEAERVHVGLAAPARLKTLRLEAGDPEGTSQGKAKRIDHVTARFHRTAGGEASGDDGATFDPLVFEDTDQLLGDAPGLFTGDQLVTLETGWGTRAQVELRQQDPLPMTALGLVYRVESNPRGGAP